MLDSDGTLVLTVGTIRGGTLLTKNAAQKREKPYLVVDLKEHAEITAVVDWMKDNEIRVLNVAGPRASQCARSLRLGRSISAQTALNSREAKATSAVEKSVSQLSLHAKRRRP